MFLKSKNPNIKVVLADPQVGHVWRKATQHSLMLTAWLQGSVLYNWFAHGTLERSEGSSITEGSMTLLLLLPAQPFVICLPSVPLLPSLLSFLPLYRYWTGEGDLQPPRSSCGLGDAGEGH